MEYSLTLKTIGICLIVAPIVTIYLYYCFRDNTYGNVPVEALGPDNAHSNSDELVDELREENATLKEILKEMQAQRRGTSGNNASA